MPRVLVTSTYFDTDVSIGSARMAGLARYLPAAGWTPTILTPRIPGTPAVSRDEVEIIEYDDLYARAKTAVGHESRTEPSGRSDRLRRRVLTAAQYALVPDYSIGWYPGARRKLHELRRDGRTFDVILSSSNPKTPHLVGRTAHRLFATPWVADLRDFWTIDHYYSYGWPRRSAERRLERSVLGAADALVTVSQPYADRLGAFLDRDVHSILNGFDPADWNDPPAPLTEKLTLTYTGSLALGLRDPTMLLAAIRRLADTGRIELEDFELRFFGRHDHLLDELSARFGLSGVVTQPGYVARQEALRRQRESHGLLVLLYDHPDEAGVLTGKLEYLAARRPILAVGGPGGAMEELLRETGAGEHVRSGDTERLEDVLETWWRTYRETRSVSYHGNASRVQELAQPRMAERFAAVFEGVAARS
jgi:glycosyltransferase involved in cell wall biosynthesis